MQKEKGRHKYLCFRDVRQRYSDPQPHTRYFDNGLHNHGLMTRNLAQYYFFHGDACTHDMKINPGGINIIFLREDRERESVFFPPGCLGRRLHWVRHLTLS